MPQKILVLDDELEFATMLKSVLEQHFFLVDATHHPEEALQKIEDQSFDLVIADYKMPVMDGADFIVRARRINPRLPVILVSGLMNTNELLKVANIGATMVFEKPIQIDSLIRVVSRHVQPLTADEFFIKQKSVSGADASGLTPEQVVTQLKVLTAKSPAMAAFVFSLWKAVRDQSHVFVKLPRGSEVELLLREASAWLGRPGARIHTLSAEVFNPKGCRALFGAIPNDTNLAPCIGVIGYDTAPLSKQSELIQLMANAPEEVSFMHFFSHQALEKGESSIDRELLDLASENLCVMPPLSSRLSDLAHFVCHYLPIIAAREGKKECGQLDVLAIGPLLNYSWPLNFSELLEVLRRCVILSQRIPITRDIVRNVLKRMGASGTDERSSLETLLLREQRGLVSRMLGEYGNDLFQLLTAADVPTSATKGALTVDTLPLLYPDLLNTR